MTLAERIHQACPCVGNMDRDHETTRLYRCNYRCPCSNNEQAGGKCLWEGHAIAGEVGTLQENAWATEVNLDESAECAHGLFELVCKVLDNKPDAQAARQVLQKHVEHVKACQKGACDTELYGSGLQRKVAALTAKVEEGHVARCICVAGCSSEGCDCTAPYVDPRCVEWRKS